MLDLSGVANDAALAGQAVTAQVGALPHLCPVTDDGRSFDQGPAFDKHPLAQLDLAAHEHCPGHDHRGAGQGLFSVPDPQGALGGIVVFNP